MSPMELAQLQHDDPNILWAGDSDKFSYSSSIALKLSSRRSSVYIGHSRCNEVRSAMFANRTRSTMPAWTVWTLPGVRRMVELIAKRAHPRVSHH